MTVKALTNVVKVAANLWQRRLWVGLVLHLFNVVCMNVEDDNDDKRGPIFFSKQERRANPNFLFQMLITCLSFSLTSVFYIWHRHLFQYNCKWKKKLHISLPRNWVKNRSENL